MTTKTNLPAEKAPDPTAVDVHTDAFLRASNIVAAINANLPPGSALPAIPADYVFRKRDREVVSTAFHAAFELIGGVPQFAHWGAQNPKDFYQLYARLLPSGTETAVGGGTTINFVSSIPANPLDLVTVDETGRVVNVTDLPE